MDVLSAVVPTPVILWARTEFGAIHPSNRAVVRRPCTRGAQHRKGAVDELLAGCSVGGLIDIRVVLARESPVGRLHDFGFRELTNLEDLVPIVYHSMFIARPWRILKPPRCERGDRVQFVASVRVKPELVSRNAPATAAAWYDFTVKVADLTVEQLSALVRDAVTKALHERDPDYGLGLQPQVERRLREQLARPEVGIPLEEIVAELDSSE